MILSSKCEESDVKGYDEGGEVLEEKNRTLGDRDKNRELAKWAGINSTTKSD